MSGGRVYDNDQFADAEAAGVNPYAGAAPNPINTEFAPALRVVSFGYGHGTPPAADITVDVRDWFRDPHIDPELRQLTGLDDRVVMKVLDTEGVYGFLNAMSATITVLLGLRVRTVTVAVGCVGGRHRSVVIAAMLGERARANGWPVEVEHLHVDRPVIQRGDAR